MRLTPDKRLHSAEHLLADDLSKMLLEPKRFAAYLGIAGMYEASDLRALAKYVLAKPGLEPRNRGRYFFGALKGLAVKNSRRAPRGVSRGRTVLERASKIHARNTNSKTSK